MTRKTRRTIRTLALSRSRATGRHRIDALVNAFGSTDPETRCLAALKLGRHGPPESMEQLEAAVGGEDLELEYCARTALAQMRARLDQEPIEMPPVEELRRRLTSPYPQERSGAVRLLARAHGKLAVPALVAVLAQEGDPGVLALIARVLGLHGAAAQREHLLRLLNHRDTLVRAAAVEALWGVEDAEVLKAVVPLLKDESPKVRGVALVLMIRRSHPTAQQMAEKVLAAQKLWMRLAALFALGPLHEAWARQALIRHIRTVSLPRLVRSLAREAIVLSGREAPVKDEAEPGDTIYSDLTRHLPPLDEPAQLKAALESQDPLLRVHALQNARRFPEPSVMPLLTPLVKFEQDPLVQATLVKALGRIGGPSQVETIRPFLEHDDERVRSNAIEALALAQLGPELEQICKGLLVEEEAPRLQKQAAAQLFASNPQEAVAHFRGMVLGEDSAARTNALQILATIQDDRLVGVLRDALKDPRRDVYAATVTAMRRIAHQWVPARELLEAFERGDVVGEVIDGDPVSALLYEMNSAKSADRVRAMSRLASARDLRVDTVLELNLGSRDPEVASEAARVLRERHRQFTLPRLYLRLGDTFTARTRAGELLVPQELADAMPEYDPGDRPEDRDEDRVRWIGKALYDAFEEDIELDEHLRTLCRDVRDALEQLGTIRPSPPPSSVPNPMSATGLAPRSRPDTMRTQALPQPPESVADGGPGMATGRAVVVAGLFAVACLAVLFSWESGTESAAGDAGPVQADQATRMLDAMGLESRPERFRERFRGRRLSFAAKVATIADQNAALLRSGTVLFRLKAPRSSPLPPGLRVGQVCDVTATVVDLENDGSIHVEGSLQVSAGT